MKETREKVSYTVSIYTANDGKEFSSKKKCEEYEERLERDRIFALIPCEKVDGYDWYYCSNQSEFLKWLEHMGENKYEYADGFTQFPITKYSFLPGWYAIDEDYDYGYERNYIYPLFLDDHIESHKESIAKHKSSLELLKNLKQMK